MQQPKQSSRKKFLWWGAAAVTAITALPFFRRTKKIIPPAETTTVKMLTQDGRLVEIDKNLLASGGTKISTDELKQWVNKKSAQ